MRHFSVGFSIALFEAMLHAMKRFAAEILPRLKV
jgi:hypothetical protein